MADQLGVGIIGVGSLALEAILPHLSQEDVKDRMALTAYNGPVSLDGVGGDVHARTTNGPADIRRN